MTPRAAGDGDSRALYQTPHGARYRLARTTRTDVPFNISPGTMCMEHFDCIIIGAGPAGLTAATYLARFRRRVVVLDAGRSRARWIPVSHNCPGFPVGVEGRQLLSHLRAQTERYDVVIRHAEVDDIVPSNGGFSVRGTEGTLHAPCLLIATGIVDRLPEGEGLEDAIAAGSLRLCAVCDGYEARDESIGVYGSVSEAIGHAEFLRTFSQAVCILSPDDDPISDGDRQRADRAHVDIHQGVRQLRFSESGCTAERSTGHPVRVATVYPVLGCIPSTGLAAGLNVTLDGAGKILVDDAMETNVSGVFAAGDVVSGLNQISVAVGHAAIAATTIHRRLPPNWRPRQGPGDVDGSIEDRAQVVLDRA